MKNPVMQEQAEAEEIRRAGLEFLSDKISVHGFIGKINALRIRHQEAQQ